MPPLRNSSHKTRVCHQWGQTMPAMRGTRRPAACARPTRPDTIALHPSSPSPKTEEHQMVRDERGLALSTDSKAAVDAFDRAVEHYLKYHVDTMSLVGNAIAADPQFVMGHCLKGYL